MELRQLRFFLAVADELHFGRAAQKLHVAEQPLGYQIKKLESELGFMLLKRTTRSVLLTPAGRAFAEDARKLIEQSEYAVDTARRIATGDAGVIRLGYESSTAPSILPAFIKCFNETYPDIDLVITECGVGGLALIDEGNFDACLISRYAPIPSRFEYTLVMRDVALCALPLDHPLARGAEVSLRDLSDTPFLGYLGQVSEPANHFMARLAMEFDLTFLQKAETHMALLALVSVGIGFTAATGTMSKLMSGEVSYLRFVDPEISIDHGLALSVSGQAPTAKALKSVALRLAKDFARSTALGR